MDMNKYQGEDTIPVPRPRVFVMDDGTFVVQWEENRVQGLLTGRYYSYSVDQFGTRITDYELKQLRDSGVVNHYDDELVYISAVSPIMAQNSTRSYYLNTTQPKSELTYIENALRMANLLDEYAVRVQQGFVIIRGTTGIPFRTFDDAERARETLVAQLPDLLGNLVVAFVEVNKSA